MTLRHGVTLYLVVGIIAALLIVYRTRSRDAMTLASAALAIPLWPLWAPFALSSSATSSQTKNHPAVVRARNALAEAVRACEGTALCRLLSRNQAEALALEVERVAARLAEMDAVIATSALDEPTAVARVVSLESSGANERIILLAKAHRDAAARVTFLRLRQESVLEEITGSIEVLRTNLIAARLEGSTDGNVEHLVTEVWARLETLRSLASEASALTSAPKPTSAAPR